MMRIITGSARGTKLASLEGELTRPTAERAKEAIFSALQFHIRGKRVLDLFGGSGQMGLEALSRGAAHAVFVDRAREAVNIIEENLRRTHLGDRASVQSADACGFLTSYRGGAFDLVFLDPPYASGLIPRCLKLLRERNLLTEAAMVVCEAGEREAIFGGDAALEANFQVYKENRYGAAWVLILAPIKEEV